MNINQREGNKMRVMSYIKDKRINSTNVLLDCSYGEYLKFASDIIKNNELQRKRVKTSKTVYALLKDDMKHGCVMPPIVLAASNISYSENGDEILKQICKAPENVMILDGLQRTYTLIDAKTEMEGKDGYEGFLQHMLRLEVYLGINKFGVLYRMLTLNTGQTPMSIRHQLEIMYNDMMDETLDGVKIVRDTDGAADPDNNEFVFKNTIEGFNSYLNRKEFPIDREELLDNIRVLEKMSEEANGEDIYQDYVRCYAHVFSAMRKITNNHEVTDDELEEYDILGSVFGNKASKIFSSSQAMTGFGAAAGKMKDNGLCNDFETIIDRTNELQKITDNEQFEWMILLLKKIDVIKNTSKKIGNAQRMFFQYFFRELYNPESDSYLNLRLAVDNGYQKYQSQVE